MTHSTRQRALIVPLSLLLNACGGGGDNRPPPPKPELTIYVTVLSGIENVRELRAQLSPATIIRTGSGVVTSVLTNYSGSNLLNTCEVTTDRGWTCTPDSFRYVALIDNSRPSFDAIVSAIEIAPGSYSNVTLTTTSVANVRDTFVILEDGRECEAEIVSATDSSTIGYRFDTEYKVEPGEERFMNIILRFTTTTLDPAHCAEGYVGARALRAEIAWVETTIPTGR